MGREWWDGNGVRWRRGPKLLRQLETPSNWFDPIQLVLRREDVLLPPLARGSAILALERPPTRCLVACVPQSTMNA
jgi:hypothetical protein